MARDNSMSVQSKLIGADRSSAPETGSRAAIVAASGSKGMIFKGFSDGCPRRESAGLNTPANAILTEPVSPCRSSQELG